MKRFRKKEEQIAIRENVGMPKCELPASLQGWSFDEEERQDNKIED
jgi:hypothetical protein